MKTRKLPLMVFLLCFQAYLNEYFSTNVQLTQNSDPYGECFSILPVGPFYKKTYTTVRLWDIVDWWCLSENGRSDWWSDLMVWSLRPSNIWETVWTSGHQKTVVELWGTQTSLIGLESMFSVWLPLGDQLKKQTTVKSTHVWFFVCRERILHTTLTGHRSCSVCVCIYIDLYLVSMSV